MISHLINLIELDTHPPIRTEIKFPYGIKIRISIFNTDVVLKSGGMIEEYVVTHDFVSNTNFGVCSKNLWCWIGYNQCEGFLFDLCGIRILTDNSIVI